MARAKATRRSTVATPATSPVWRRGDRVRIIRQLRTSRPTLLGQTGVVAELVDSLAIMPKHPEYRGVKVELDGGATYFFGPGELGRKQDEIAW